jgi:hypothetical protein
MYANVGNPGENIPAPDSKQHRIKGISTWNDGTGMFFLKNIDIKPGQIIKFLAYGPPRMSLTINSYYLN